MIKLPHFTIRTMTPREVDTVIGWAAEEGWNPGLHDATCFRAADPEGFLVGLVGDEPVAAISAVRYGASFGFLGLYLVRPEYRGMGFGLQIWKAGLGRLEGRTIGLDGVIEQQKNYARSGFKLAWRNIRYEGIGGGEMESHEGIQPLSAIPFDMLVACDKPFFPDDRKAFLNCWINQSGSGAFGIIEHNRLAGYGVIRSCQSGFKIGPLFADRSDLAEKLFCTLKASIPDGAPLFLDIPEPNKEALELVRRHNMQVVFETARMYKGKKPKLPIGNIYGITTFELG